MQNDELKHFTIKRNSESEYGTFGVILDEGLPFALTVEPFWQNNAKNISCIPDGDYLCKRIESPRFGDTFEITNVTRRTNILFHWGNFGTGDKSRLIESDTKGCVVIGEEFGVLYGIPAVLSSKRGFREFKKRVNGLDEFNLKIENCWG